MQYVSTIEIEGSSITSIIYQPKDTEAESVAAALADFTASGYAAEELLSIETRAYEGP